MIVFGVFYLFISQKYQTPYVDLLCFLLVSVASLFDGVNMVAIGVLLWLSAGLSCYRFYIWAKHFDKQKQPSLPARWEYLIMSTVAFQLAYLEKDVFKTLPLFVSALVIVLEILLMILYFYAWFKDSRFLPREKIIVSEVITLSGVFFYLISYTSVCETYIGLILWLLLVIHWFVMREAV